MKQFDFAKEILTTPEKMVEFNEKSRDERLDIMWTEEVSFYANELRKEPEDTEVSEYLREIISQSNWRKLKMGGHTFG